LVRIRGSRGMAHRSLQRYLFGLCIALTLLLYVGTYCNRSHPGEPIKTEFLDKSHEMPIARAPQVAWNWANAAERNF
jgi:hypothetical protein